MNIFYIDGSILQVEREDSETDDFFAKRLVFLMDRRGVKDIQQYSHIYANKAFYGLVYDEAIEEQLEIIAAIGKKRPTVTNMKTSMKQLPVLDYMTYFASFGVKDAPNILIVSQVDESFNALKEKTILRPLSGSDTVKVTQIQDKKYDTIVIYLSLPLVERVRSFFLKMNSMLSKGGLLIIIDPLTIVDRVRDEFATLYTTIWPQFTHPTFHRPATVRSLMETCDFTFIREEAFLLDGIVCYSLTKN